MWQTSRPVRPKQDLASNIGTTPLHLAEINLDELPHDPANRKRIGQYTKNPKKQDEIFFSNTHSMRILY